MLEIKLVTKTFGEVVALKNLDLQINTGEILGLLGPNGAGKTTTMRLLTGVFAPDTGEILFDGVPFSKNTLLIKSQIGYLPENNPLYPEMLVGEYLALVASLRLYNRPSELDDVKAVAEKTGISDKLMSPIKNLSKGYKQRVGLAAALIGDPKVLVLDEPTEGLDPVQRIEIRNLIKSLSSGHTILISSHVLQEVESLCGRVVIIDRGSKVYDGPVFSAGNLEDLFKGLGK